MKDYTIYVTEEIAKKAMEKGFDFDDGYYDGMCVPTPDVPTAEQICGWLREKGIEVLPSIRFKLGNTNDLFKQKYYCKVFTTDSIWCVKGFIDGARWADKNPSKELVDLIIHQYIISCDNTNIECINDRINWIMKTYWNK